MKLRASLIFCFIGDLAHGVKEGAVAVGVGVKEGFENAGEKISEGASKSTTRR